MEALASDGLWDIDPDGPYDEPISDLEAEALSFEEDFLIAKGIVVDEDEDIESESAAHARGKGNVGSKMGRKKRAPGMLAPGWHVFHQPASGGPMRKYYAGPRIAARRIAGIMNGEEVPEGRKKSPNETASKTRKARVTREPKAPVKAPDTYKMYKNIVKLQQKVERIKQRMDNTDNKEKKKELAQQARDLNAEIRPLQRDLRKAEKLIEKTPTSRQIKAEQAKKRSGTKSSSPATKNTGKSSRLDNPSQNKGQSYNEWKASVTKAYGRGVKFVSYDVPSSGVSAELKGKLVDYYSLDLDAK